MKVNENLRKDVDSVVSKLVLDINPYERTKQCLASLSFNDGKRILVSIGKAAWSMAKAVCDNTQIDLGAVITKYGHSKGDLKNTKVFEAGHPITDENSIKASEYVLDITSDLNDNDEVILCISGGGSALFEKPLIPLEELQDINNQLIKSSADINEINIIRKRLSTVKAGRFALHCGKAHINAIVLSDVIGNDLSSIASGPVSIDNVDSIKAIEIVNKYHIKMSKDTLALLYKETPKDISNVDTYIISSVEQLCIDTKNALEKLGYNAEIIQNNCKDNVLDIAKRFSQIKVQENSAYIIGGESVVEVKGDGLGGRNTHLALLCAKNIKDSDTCVFTFGSDGTDGPTDAAGGYVDCSTYNRIDVDKYIENCDAYHGLESAGGLIKTGPTGSNVNDVYVMLHR